MTHASARSPVILSALFWYGGGLMIAAGAMLSRLSHGNDGFLLEL